MIDGTAALLLPKHFTHEECDNILNVMTTYGQKSEATIYNNAPGSKRKTSHDHRKGTVYSFMTGHNGASGNPHLDKLYTNKLNIALSNWRAESKFSPHILPNNFEFQLAVYNEPGDHFRLHRDQQPALDSWMGSFQMKTVRKLSMSVVLTDASEYEGGGFRLENTEGSTSRIATNKGDVVVFPSWLNHQVDPIISGHREALVVWAHGDFWL